MWFTTWRTAQNGDFENFKVRHTDKNLVCEEACELLSLTPKTRRLQAEGKLCSAAIISDENRHFVVWWAHLAKKRKAFFSLFSVKFQVFRSKLFQMMAMPHQFFQIPCRIIQTWIWPSLVNIWSQGQVVHFWWSRVLFLYQEHHWNVCKVLQMWLKSKVA